MKVLIIEDEKAAVRNLTAVLKLVAPDMEVTGTLDCVVDAVDWFATHPMPGLVFMDIHLADGSAFEIFEHVDITCPVIFTTAYDEYALRAFKVNSIDYLLKPIGQEEVEAALAKLKHLHRERLDELDFLKLIQNLKREESYKTHFLIPVKGDKLLPLSVEDISYFYIADGIVKAVPSEGKGYVLTQTMDELAECLNPSLFFRANRQYLISRGAVKDIDLWFNNRLAINLYVAAPERIVVSKARVGEFKEWFAGER